MKFNKPEFLYLIILAPFIFWWLESSFFRKKKNLEKNFSRKNLKRIGVLRQHGKVFFKNILLTLVYILIIVSLAEPQYGFKEIELSKSKANIFIALDVSLSMDAQDVKPSRLEVAKRKILDFIDQLKGERVSLICFAGVPFVNIPLTNDYSIFNDYVKIINTDLIPIQGTNFYRLITKIVDIVKRKGLLNTDVLILSDGENFSGDIDKALDLCKKYKIRIFTIGIGGKTPVPIKLKDGTLKKDKNGNIVMTSMNEKFLEKIALATGGVYVKATYSPIDVETIYKKMKELNIKFAKSEFKRKEYINRFQWFLFPCFILFAIYFLIDDRKKTLFITILILTSWNNLSAANPSILNNEGIKLYKKGKYKDAIRKFKKAYKIDHNSIFKYNEAIGYYKLKKFKKSDKLFSEIKNNKLKSKIFYNRGVIAYREKNFKKALEYFKKAIISNPNDIDARIDYELTLKKFNNSKKQNKNKQNNQKNQKKKNKEHKQNKQNKNNKNRNRKNKEQQKNKNFRKNIKNYSDLQKLLNLYNENPRILKQMIRKRLKNTYIIKPQKDW